MLRFCFQSALADHACDPRSFSDQARRSHKTKVRPRLGPCVCFLLSEYAFCVVKRGAVKCSEELASTCHFHPISGWTQAGSRLMVVMRSQNSPGASLLFCLIILLFSDLFSFGRDAISTITASSLILLFVQSVPSLLPLPRPLRRLMQRRRRYANPHDL